jgi:large subunit ribosomal protein L17
VTSLFLYEKIVTTEAKAKELRKLAERMITLAKRQDLHARRQAAEVVADDKVLKKLFDSIGGRYKDRNGGYTRITKLDYRMGDGAPLAAIELVASGAAPEPPARPSRWRGRRGHKTEAPGGHPASPAPRDVRDSGAVAQA